EAAELAPLLVGPSIAEAHPRAVCTENDLLRLAPPTDRVDRALHDAGWLARDHVTEANARLSSGSVSVALAYWADRLRPSAPDAPAPASPITDLLGVLRSEEPVPSETVTEALRRYLTGGGADNLVPELKRLVA